MPSPLIMPKLGMYMDDVLLLEWSIAEGAHVSRGDVVFVLETEKTTADVQAEADGFLHRTVAPGEKVAIGAEVGILASTREEYEALLAPGASDPARGVQDGNGDRPPAAPAPALAEARGRAGRVLASPRALAVLARHEVEPSAVGSIRGTGPNGRVIERDVLAWLADRPASGGAEPVGPAVSERRPLRGRRGTIARRMVESLQVSAQLTSVLEVDASRLVAERERLNAEPGAARISYTALLVRVVAQALRQHPLLNSRIAGDAIELLADVNVGVAVDTPDGLIVPVVHAADRLSIRDLNERIAGLVGKARDGSLAVSEVEGGTFTLSNAGVLPVDITTAILNPPQSALLWVGRIRDRPIVVDRGLQIRPTMQACLTYDHRSIDGLPAAEFLGTLERLVGGLGASGAGEGTAR